MPTQYLPIASDDEAINRMQVNIRSALDPISTDLLLNRQVISATIGATATTIYHNLGRQPAGWIVVDRLADARVWRVSWDTKTIVLQASGSVAVKIFLF